MAGFGRPIPPKWAYFDFGPTSQTAVSLRSTGHNTHIRALPPFGDIAHFVCFLGHVTRFRGNRCCGNKESVFSKDATPTFYK